MIEVSKLIPKVYNQSRDFSVFTGVLQIMLNELDIKSLKLLELPNESILPPELATYSHLRGYFRFLIKNKGTIESILQSVYLSGGELICRLDEEKDNLGNPNWDYMVSDRGIINNDLKKYAVYYREGPELIINLKDPGKINQDLFKKLLYYIKPVDLIIKLKKGELRNT